MNYRMDALPSEYDVEKIWLILRLYRKWKMPEVYRYLEDYCDGLIGFLKKDKITKYGMQAVADLIPAMCQYGYKIEEELILDAYYRNTKWAEEISNMKYFKECCQNIFDEFMEKHLEEIKERLPGLILEDTEYYLDDEDELDMFLMRVPEILTEFGLIYTKQFEKSLYWAAERPIPKKEEKIRRQLRVKKRYWKHHIR